MAAADVNNLDLTDAANASQTPFPSVNITITNCVIGANLTVFQEAGGVENESQFTSSTGNAAGDADFVVNATIPNDTPLSGTIYLVKQDSNSEENRIIRARYSSWTGSTFTFESGESGTTDGAGTGVTLIDSGAFSGTTIQVGDPIRNTTDLSFAWVKEIVDNNTILTTQLEGGTDDTWQSGDGWETMTLGQAYTNGS